MNLQAARTWQSRLLHRVETDPTRSAAALRAVIRAHGPTDPDPLDGVTGAICPECLAGPGIAVAYPCATTQTIALELGVPLPEAPAYEGLLDV